MEPKINKQVKSALFAPSTGIINPFELVVALMENAMENGVELHLNEEVMKIIKEDNCYKIFLNAVNILPKSLSMLRVYLLTK